jgi:lipopolysaccharide/colanic/teichoic acid biosynthesis glycosyltransferase
MISLNKPLRSRFPLGYDGQAHPELMSWRQQAHHCLYLGIKRLFDIVSALVGCVAVLTLCPLIWLANRLSDPGDLFYWQERVGQDGRPFRMVKFRSMIMNAEADTGPVWAEANDGRVTPVGRVLRKIRLDELPQVWNVLRGEMSLIGPRPERPQFVASLMETIPTFQARHAIKVSSQ